MTKVHASFRAIACLAVWMAASTPSRANESDTKGLDFFERKIRPLLVRHCLECHGAEGKVKGKLRLDSRDAILRGGASGPAVLPGKPGESLLIQAVRHDDIKMPPKEKLSDAAIADFETWIALGVPFPTQPLKRPTTTSSAYVSLEEGRKHWAFQPPKRPAVPVPRQTEWAWSDIDRFILARIEEEKLAPVRDAEPLTLLRRLSYDLIGLPPTPDELRTFQVAYVKEGRKAVAAEVDRLLASSQFGEKWARHWLDVVRYAESAGGQSNQRRHGAWRYRDWVIRAINADKPYTQFLAEQIAGDLLPAIDAADRHEKQLATGFLALGLDDGTYYDRLEEQITMIGAAALGLTSRNCCARLATQRQSSARFTGTPSPAFKSRSRPDLTPRATFQTQRFLAVALTWFATARKWPKKTNT